MKSLLVGLLIYSIIYVPVATAADAWIAPSGIIPKSSEEYYSTNTVNKVLIPINVWGNVKTPGLHFVPFGSVLNSGLSAAGGPLPYNSSDILLIHANGKQETVDMYNEGFKRKIQPNDTMQVDVNSFRANLPLIVSVIGSLAAIITVGVVLSSRK